LLSRLALIPLLICMGFIIVSIMQFSVLNSGDNGYEINTAFVYFIIYLALFFTGPGKYSLDSRFLKS
jgi:putative oxidoreductase